MPQPPFGINPSAVLFNLRRERRREVAITRPVLVIYDRETERQRQLQNEPKDDELRRARAHGKNRNWRGERQKISCGSREENQPSARRKDQQPRADESA